MWWRLSTERSGKASPTFEGGGDTSRSDSEERILCRRKSRCNGVGAWCVQNPSEEPSEAGAE